MNKSTQDDIRDHALSEYPREACGLLVIVKGKERYIPCRNIAETASDHFVLSPQDYATAEDQGEIISIVHSHPDELARPSQADKVACETSGLPWMIVSVMPGGAGLPVAGDIVEFEPEGYEAPLVGRAWHHGMLDCWALCRDWYKREMGIDLPNPERKDGWWDDGHSDLYTDNYADAGFVPVTGEMRRGDMILMQIRSRNGVPNHAAIYLGDGLILQHLANRLSSRDPWGGYWRDCHRMTLRHRSQIGSTVDA